LIQGGKTEVAIERIPSCELPDCREGRHDAVHVGNLPVAAETDNLSLANIHLGEGEGRTVTMTVAMVMTVPKIRFS
jgi:hypothetical protein